MSEKNASIRQVISKCWQDEAFKERLMANPDAVLKAEGVSVPDGVTVSVTERSDRSWTLVIPERPDELSADEEAGMQQQSPMGRIIARCWDDDAFKQKLKAEPIATLKAEGVPVPEGVSVSVADNSSKAWTLVIPERPEELGEEELEQVAGGFSWGAWNTSSLYSLGSLEGRGTVFIGPEDPTIIVF